MSKYTTEVRYICEHNANLEESKGANDVDTIIANSWNKIFTTNCTFFDNNYRSVLCSKILKHYYLREIGCETVGIWKLWMNTKLEEIMPYYNQLYESALLDYDPLKDVDYKKLHSGTNDGTKNIDSTVDKDGTKSSVLSGTETGTVGDARDITSDGTWSSNDSKTDRYSDTPQGTINNTDVVGDAYLTNVRIIGDTSSGTNHDTTYDNNLQTRNLTTGSSISDTYQEDVSNSVDETTHSTDSYIDTISGKMGTTPYSDLINKFRDTFLNIDMMVIEEFDELFLQLW